jgi:ABC-type transport system involved in multi-copper enzyme maturation permease subunit
MNVTAPQGSVTPGTLDLTQDSPVPFGRLVKVELRKMLDTRAGLWLLISIVLLTGLVLVIFLINAEDKSFVNAMQASATPQGILLPVLGILLVTSEWSQRTAMVTFTLEPHRGKVLWSKVTAAVVLGLAAVALALVVASLTTAIGGTPDAWHDASLRMVLQYVLLQLLSVLGGLVFGLLFLNTAAAIVTSYALPIAFSIITSLITSFHKVQPWVDPGTAQTPLQNGELLSGQEWAHVLVTSLIWVVVPFAVGMWRVLRAEVK